MLQKVPAQWLLWQYNFAITWDTMDWKLLGIFCKDNKTGCTEIQVIICENHILLRGICLSSCPQCWVRSSLNNSIQSVYKLGWTLILTIDVETQLPFSMP